jgi:hypothetical protein
VAITNAIIANTVILAMATPPPEALPIVRDKSGPC